MIAKHLTVNGEVIDTREFVNLDEFIKLANSAFDGTYWISDQVRQCEYCDEYFLYDGTSLSCDKCSNEELNPLETAIDRFADRFEGLFNYGQ